ncbi:hypothetical protein BY996DRAFT_6457194 [Phakopsora pachyrhizi]|nr:hypothetical protein BY996DRAFT_6457194 [Phakopsora pachyrhizi]
MWYVIGHTTHTAVMLGKRTVDVISCSLAPGQCYNQRRHHSSILINLGIVLPRVLNHRINASFYQRYVKKQFVYLYAVKKAINSGKSISPSALEILFGIIKFVHSVDFS